MADRHEQEKVITQQLRTIFKAAQAHSKIIEKECGLSSAKLWMLYEISVKPGILVSQLARELSIHPSTCSNMLDKIEEEELIHRNRSKVDQRSVHLFMTDKGQKLLAKAPYPPQGKLISTLQALSQDQLTRLEACLKTFIEALHFDENKVTLPPIISD